MKVTMGRRKCSWCGKDMGPADTEYDTHGICPRCLELEIKKMDLWEQPATDEEKEVGKRMERERKNQSSDVRRSGV